MAYSEKMLPWSRGRVIATCRYGQALTQRNVRGKRRHLEGLDGMAAYVQTRREQMTKTRASSVDEPSSVTLAVEGLEADIVGLNKKVLNGLNLKIKPGEVHAIMGQNGSGKSTFSKVLVGHPEYEVVKGSVLYKGENLLDMEPEERSHAGLFLSFQNPVEVPGVNNTDFLRLACNSRRKALGEPELDPIEFYGYLAPLMEEMKVDSKFLNRNVNEGFSGGERKRNEILQLAVLDADLAILDEIDSGLDIDALREVAEGVNLLRKRKAGMSILLITHYQRLLDYIEPDYVHIMKDGQVVTTGDKQLAKELESSGYKGVAE